MAPARKKSPNEWYIEPPWIVDALLDVERPFRQIVLDPCCGIGTIPKQIRERGVCRRVIGADLVDRGGAEFIMPFSESIPSIGHNSIISNPPFSLAQEFINIALDYTPDRICVLLRLAFLEGQKRKSWFSTVPLARVWVSSKRVTMPPGDEGTTAKGGKTAHAWFVFEQGHKGPAQIGHI